MTTIKIQVLFLIILPFCQLATRNLLASAVPVVSPDEVKKSAEKLNSKEIKEWLEIGTPLVPLFPVKLNQDAVLECEAVGSPAPVIYWLKDGKPIDEQFKDSENEIFDRDNSISKIKGEKSLEITLAHRHSKLPLNCIRPEDEGKYTCVAYNNIGVKQKETSTYLDIQVDSDPAAKVTPSCDTRLMNLMFGKEKTLPAHIISSEKYHIEVMGRDVTLPCLSVGFPRPKTTWINVDGSRIEPDHKFQVSSNGDLVIRDLSWDDMGEYFCVAENEHGRDEAPTFLYPAKKD